MKRYIEAWIRDWMLIFSRELRHIFSDGGVMVIFFLAGLVYPLLYGIIYHNGTVDDMPVAVIDASGSAAGREFIRKLDATRELAVTRSCPAIAEAEKLMQEREVHGIVLIPEDFDLCLAEGRQAHVSTYADMSSFLYYKNLSMGVNNVMLDSMSGSTAHRHPADHVLRHIDADGYHEGGKPQLCRPAGHAQRERHIKERLG